MTDEVVERVARAMFNMDHEEGWDRGEKLTKEIYWGNAQAALAAIPENSVIREGQAYDFTVWAIGEQRKAAEATREACAEIADGWAFPPVNTAEGIAAAIRALDITKITGESE